MEGDERNMQPGEVHSHFCVCPGGQQCKLGYSPELPALENVPYRKCLLLQIVLFLLYCIVLCCIALYYIVLYCALKYLLTVLKIPFHVSVILML